MTIDVKSPVRYPDSFIEPSEGHGLTSLVYVMPGLCGKYEICLVPHSTLLLRMPFLMDPKLIYDITVQRDHSYAFFGFRRCEHVIGLLPGVFRVLEFFELFVDRYGLVFHIYILISESQKLRDPASCVNEHDYEESDPRGIRKMGIDDF